MKKVISLKKWGKLRYGEDCPVIDTLRRWTRQGLIKPQPQKNGREYFVQEDAIYVND